MRVEFSKMFWGTLGKSACDANPGSDNTQSYQPLCPESYQAQVALGNAGMRFQRARIAVQ